MFTALNMRYKFNLDSKDTHSKSKTKKERPMPFFQDIVNDYLLHTIQSL